MNKLAVLAFALLLFFSTMMWYLANGSLNDYLKSQVLLQSQYYSAQPSQLLSANFSNASGITTFTQFSLNNINGLAQPHVLTIQKISAQLAQVPTQQLDAPSIQKKTTTLIHIQELRLSHVKVWSETSGENTKNETNLTLLFKQISTQLAIDYPALYPQISAELYAQKYPDRNEELILETTDINKTEKYIETNQAIIASNTAKQKKRILGKATTRIKISNVIIDDLTLTVIKNNQGSNEDNKKSTKNIKHISLGSFGDNEGLASNQIGGELLKQLLNKLIIIEKKIIVTTINK